MSYIIHTGSNLDVLPTLPDNSIDAIVTDPPYELGFMGKSWDSTGIAYNVALWKECLRVLKPGGHLLAFSGSRTYHRMTCAIEDAGFEVRDQMMWVYGSGFPKSLNISKALDKMDAVEEQQMRRYRFTEWVRSTGLSSKQINEATGTNMGGHYTTSSSQPAIMTREHLELCRHLIKEIPEWVEREADIRTVESKNFEKREVLKIKKNNISEDSTWSQNVSSGRFKVGEHEIKVTSAFTNSAKEWEGWGTALKPAHEPICLARKPIKGTVAENVLKWGVGGLNTDGCRVGEGTGRFPANLMHDGSQEVLELFPGEGEHNAARFFYCPKASKSDRNEGCEGMEGKTYSMSGNDSDSAGDIGLNKAIHRKNFHPTVKPTELMRYLCRLITPPGGTVLDPFNGSGSTGKAAVLEGFNYVGIEMNPEYVTISEARIKAAIER